MSKRALQAVTAAFGVLALVTGVMAVIGGPAGMLDGQRTTATVDSEVRFMAVDWLAYGAATLYLAPRVAQARTAYRAWLIVMFASGLARALSYVQTGRPYPLIAGAMVAELVLPPVLWIWQSRVASAAQAMAPSAFGSVVMATGTVTMTGTAMVHAEAVSDGV